jgi:CheY-like chemotaxis protein
MNILIAEDDAPTRLLLQSLLTSWSYHVIVAHDGNEGLADYPQ